MIVVDINMLVAGLDINVWKQLIKELNLCLYDSKNTGIPPYSIDSDDKISFVDVQNMSDEDIKKLSDFIYEKNQEQLEKNKELKETIDKNTNKLIDYLRDANDEAEGISKKEGEQKDESKY